MNYIRLLMLFIFLSAYCLNTNAQSFDRKDPIDQFYEDCLHKDTSALNISNCAYQVYGKWDKEIEKYYNRLLKELNNPKDKNALVQSQKAWQAFRDAEFHTYDNIFNKTGEKWTFVRANNRVNLVKERALLLRKYYETLSGKD